MPRASARASRIRGAVAAFVATGALFALSSRLIALLASWEEIPAAGHRPAYLTLRGLAWLGVAWSLHRGLGAFFWPRWERDGGRGGVPSLIRDAVSWLGVLLALGGFLAVEAGLSVTPLWATSGAVSVVLGIALKEVILDLFVGIAVNVERPFAIGDFVQVRVGGPDSWIFGQLLEVSWRTTRLVTPQDDLVVLPDSLVGGSVVVNVCEPMPASRCRRAGAAS